MNMFPKMKLFQKKKELNSMIHLIDHLIVKRLITLSIDTWLNLAFIISHRINNKYKYVNITLLI
eukprot:jgi/Orpsp1_1/1180250/evm.model.c7180000072655.2